MRDPFRVVPIVEGHGEVDAVPVLLRRLAREIARGLVVDIVAPIRVSRHGIVKPNEFERYVELAARHLATSSGCVLVLLDADDDCAAEVARALLARGKAQRSETRLTVVMPVREFESWFIAAADSLRGRRGLSDDMVARDHPESIRDAKGWLQQRRTDGRAYSPSVDQPALAAVFDLHAARRGAASFDKLWRELTALLAQGP